jgi:Protein of unknown function (DUF4233)
VRALASSVLVFEAVVVLLAIPVALSLTDISRAPILIGGGALALACLLLPAFLRRPGAYAVGWGLQLVLILSGFVVPAMFLLGVLFTALWALGLWLAVKVERQRRAAQ